MIWSNDSPIHLTTDLYTGEDYYTLKKAGELGDFVLKTDVMWDSTSGFAGCSVNFRAEEDPVKGEHYVMLTMRLQFAPAWDIEHHKDGQYQTTLTNGTIFSGHLIDENMSINRVVLAAKGEQITVYLNGEKENTVIGSKLKSGLIQFGVWQESGRTSCTFDKIWLWRPNP